MTMCFCDVGKFMMLHLSSCLWELCPEKNKLEIAVVVDLVAIVLHTTLQRNLKLPGETLEQLGQIS